MVRSGRRYDHGRPVTRRPIGVGRFDVESGRPPVGHKPNGGVQAWRSASQLQKRYRLQDPDVRLMLQVRDGDAAAFEELVRRYQQRVLAIFDHIVPTKEQAEDLTQEVFLRVFRARERYEPGAKFSTYLFTIANNIASNAIRTLTRRREVHVADKGEASPSPLEHMAKDASGMMPTRRVDQMERAEIVRRAIDGLNDRQRMALMLCKFEGMSYAEIAETMSLTEKAVKSLLSRARMNLKNALEPYVQEGLAPEART